MDEKISVLKDHMCLTLKLPEITSGIFKEYDIIVNHNKMNITANNIVSALKGSTVAEATLILQEILKETYNQLTFENNIDTDFAEIPIKICEDTKTCYPISMYQ